MKLLVSEYCKITGLSRVAVINMINKDMLHAEKIPFKHGQFQYEIYLTPEQSKALSYDLEIKKVFLFRETYLFPKQYHHSLTKLWQKKITRSFYTPTRIYFQTQDKNIYFIFYLKPGEIAALDFLVRERSSESISIEHGHPLDAEGYLYTGFMPMIASCDDYYLFRYVANIEEYHKAEPITKRYASFHKYRITEIKKKAGEEYYQNLLKQVEEYERNEASNHRAQSTIYFPDSVATIAIRFGEGLVKFLQEKQRREAKHNDKR